MKSIQLSSIKKKIGAENFSVLRDTIFKSSYDRPSKGMTLQRDRIVNAIKDPQVKKSLENITSKAAKLENVPITWGAEWVSFKDGPHWELPHAKYPDPK